MVIVNKELLKKIWVISKLTGCALPPYKIMKPNDFGDFIDYYNSLETNNLLDETKTGYNSLQKKCKFILNEYK